MILKVAIVVVDKSKGVLDVAKVALTLAQGVLHTAKLALNAANAALEGVKVLYKVGATALTALVDFAFTKLIRASVDALCRDGTDQISRERVQRGRLTRQGTRS